jgi:hypothetical protein
LLTFAIELLADVRVLLFKLAPGAGNALLLDLGEDGVEGALDDVFAFGLGVAFGKFYFFARVFMVRLGLG